MNTIRHALLLVLSYATAVAFAAGSMGLLAFFLARLFTLGMGGGPDACGPAYCADFFQ
jgi:hypothetical protein